MRLQRLRQVFEWWREGFVSARGALEMLGLPMLYTRAEVDRRIKMAALCSIAVLRPLVDPNSAADLRMQKMLENL